MPYAISMDVLGQTHMIYTTQAINLFEIFYFLWVFEFFNSLKNRISKVRSRKIISKNLKRNMLQTGHKMIAYVMMHETITLIHLKY